MREYPIIFSGDHPRKILDGIKTQTRRVIKPQPNVTQTYFSYRTGITQGYRSEDWYKLLNACPYGQVGDLLWVRETIAEWQGTVESVKNGDLDETEALEYIIYKSGAKDWSGILKDKSYGHPWNVRPSIHMPRWASRIDRIIALLRAEHLRDISPADAQAEGGYSVEEFIKVFLKINHLPEDANPWNWVIGW